MKLFAKYSRIYLIATILVLIFAGLSYYFIIRYVLIRQLDNTLKVEEAEILDYAKTKGKLPEPANYKDQVIHYSVSEKLPKRRFKSFNRFDESEKEMESYRMLTFPLTVQGKNYIVTVTKSQAEKEDLLFLIVIISASVVILLLLMQFLANRFLLRKIWQPFYDILNSIKHFNVASRHSIPIHQSGIDEFNNLDKAVKQMTDKIMQDYDTLKNFADNASHEMQTPLAIINSKLDLLIQDPNLGEKQILQLQAMYDAVGRLSKLNQSLLLLTKIENDQFLHSEPVSMNNLLDKKLLQLEELIEAGKLKMKVEKENVDVEMNNYLADILLNNLLINSIRHNVENGHIDIKLNFESLVVSNTGKDGALDEKVIFDRFRKNGYSDGTGLGLAIVKQICDKLDFDISYHYLNNYHSFTVRF